MSRIFSYIGKYITEIIVVFLCLYALLPFLSPILLLNDSNSALGQGIQRVYSVLCHQKVERSLFLGGQKPFYTLKELKNIGYIEEDKSVYGFPYWGNEQIGYKVAFCIRDVGLYGGLAITSLILVFTMKNKVRKFSWKLILLLILPMVIDGVFQTLAEIFLFPWVPVAYIEDIPKRIITGLLFGIGSALFLIPNLKESSNISYNKDDKFNK